jgi:AraC-like DNA-binding protein
MDLTCEERPSDSPFAELIWCSHSGSGGALTSIAAGHCGLAISKIRGKTYFTVRGPEIRATSAFSPADAEFIGVMFKPGAFMPRFPPQTTLDRNDINLPEASSKRFWLDGASWEFPTFENMDTFLARLVREGLLLCDPVVDSMLNCQPLAMSQRTVQRRFLQATGLTQSGLRQIDRARYATTLLKQGVSIHDTVYEAGYFDQPHLTRSLKHFIGQTPTQIADPHRQMPLSFLYKTASPLFEYDTTDRITTTEGDNYEQESRAIAARW